MCRQVVHHDDVVGAKAGHELLLHEGAKHLGAGAGVDGHEAAKAVERQRTNHGHGLPLPLDRLARRVLATRRPAIAQRRAQPKPRLIQEDQPPYLEALLAGDEVVSLCLYLRPIAFERHRSFFCGSSRWRRAHSTSRRC